MSLRLLYLGAPKSGKTGSLAAAANAGWKIRYLDFDGNADTLLNFTAPANRKNIEIIPCLDEYKMVQKAGKESMEQTLVYASKPSAWKSFMDAMSVWPTDQSKPSEWEPTKNILVIDSMTTLALSKINLSVYSDGREGKRRNFNDYDSVQNDILKLTSLLKVYIKCPVFIMAHLQLTSANLDVDEDITNQEIRAKLYEEKLKIAAKTPMQWGPVTMGKALTNTLAAHFNGTILAEANHLLGRKIFLQPKEGLNLGVPFPLLTKDQKIIKELPLETGVKEILDAWVACQ